MSPSNTKARPVTVADIERAKVDIVGTISKYIELEKNGSEYRALCPFHSERTASFTVSPDKGIFYCFGCGAGNDAIDFVQAYEDVSFPEAVKIITGGDKVGGAPVKRQAREREDDEWIPVAPIPEDMLLTPMDIWNRRVGDGWQKIKSSARWAYRDAEGRLLGYTYRFDLPKNPDGSSGGKEIIPQSYCLNTKTGETRWKWLSFGKPRPMYGLDKLAAHPNAQVLLVEGEKTADAGQALYEAAGASRDKLVVVSWPGGGKAVKHTDWSPLAGRSVGLLPDADLKPYVEGHPRAGELMPFLEQPGTVAMLDVAARIEGLAASIKIIEPPAGVPDGWDLADPLPTGLNILHHTRTAALLLADFRAKYQIGVAPAEDTANTEDTPPTPATSAPASKPAYNQNSDEDDDLINNGYFTILGYDGGTYYVFSHEKRQVIALTKRDMSDTGLIELAPVNWWEVAFAGANASINKKAAANWIFRTAHRRGIFDSTKVRGRGAWIDKGRFVFHFGDRLIVDGKPTEFGTMRSRFVYERLPEVMAPSEIPLSSQEGAELLSAARLFRWENSVAAQLLMGWISLAPICGVLKWRSHVWISSEPGVGKSTLMNEFIKPLLPKGLALHEQGMSTEAALRQKLKADARPVLLDEFECNTERDRLRTEDVLELIRVSSSGGEVSRGTISGHANTYVVSSMYCLASVGVGLHRQADKSRVTRLELTKKGDSTDRWEKLQRELERIRKDNELSQRLFARILELLPIVLQSIDVFTKEAVAHFNSHREGDQYGTLLAGCWCLTNDSVPTAQDAQNILRANVWTDLGAGDSSNCDDSRDALNALLCASIRLDSGQTRTVSQLIAIVCGQSDFADQNPHGKRGVALNDADNCLQLHGMRVEQEKGEVLFAMGHRQLIGMVSDTDFASDIHGRLARLPGARKSREGQERAKVRFANTPLRYIAVPLDLCVSKDNGEQGTRNRYNFRNKVEA